MYPTSKSRRARPSAFRLVLTALAFPVLLAVFLLGFQFVFTHFGFIPAAEFTLVVWVAVLWKIR